MSRSWKTLHTDAEVRCYSFRFRPLFGVAPRVYVPALWLVAVLSLLFVVLVLPGVRFYGSTVELTSWPSGAAVWVDDTLIGATPIRAPIEAGLRSLRFEASGFRARDIAIDVPGRLIAGAILPRRVSVETRLEPDTTATVVERAATEFAAWALDVPAGPRVHIPAPALGRARALAGNPAAITALTGHLLAHAHGERLAEVVAIAQAGARHTGVAGLSGAVAVFAALDDAGFDLAGIVRREAKLSALQGGRWYETRTARADTAVLAATARLEDRAPESARTRRLAGLAFARIPAGSYVLGYDAPNGSHLGGVVSDPTPRWLMTAEVTRGEFARFVTDQPRWSPNALPDLVGSGLVDDRYLQDWPPDWQTRFLEPSAASELPVRYVSWFAATAFARWVDARTGPAWNVALPSRATWERAAYLNAASLPSAGTVQPAGRAPAGVYGLRNMVGNVWEWTADWYGANSDLIVAEFGVQRVVVGGSYANRDVRHTIAGSQRPAATTPYLGFRLVAVAAR